MLRFFTQEQWKSTKRFKWRNVTWFTVFKYGCCVKMALGKQKGEQQEAGVSMQVNCHEGLDQEVALQPREVGVWGIRHLWVVVVVSQGGGIKETPRSLSGKTWEMVLPFADRKTADKGGTDRVMENLKYAFSLICCKALKSKCQVVSWLWVSNTGVLGKGINAM